MKYYSPRIVHNHDDQFDSATSRKTQEVLTACRQVLPFYTRNFRIVVSKIAKFWDLKRAEFPEIRNFGIPELQSLILTLHYFTT